MLERMAAAGVPDIGDLPPEVGRPVYRELLTFDVSAVVLLSNR
jgi:hypothetical protein